MTPRTVACQPPLSMGFPSQDYWSGVSFPSPRDLPHPRIELTSPALIGEFFPTEPCTQTSRAHLAPLGGPNTIPKGETGDDGYKTRVSFTSFGIEVYLTSYISFICKHSNSVFLLFIPPYKVQVLPSEAPVCKERYTSSNFAG